MLEKVRTQIFQNLSFVIFLSGILMRPLLTLKIQKLVPKIKQRMTSCSSIVDALLRKKRSDDKRKFSNFVATILWPIEFHNFKTKK